ncbi:MAG TPA: 30S ribosomal protein S12 methylthiotransferase RimO [Candidatus Hydrogenedentes bacterium]|nr:30S ribosomal protein S12 methylthiotransferase RimO [Candidatus Hydrogenedentota bacterium]HOS03582.1 30S ribosomal protein S12 methylthiotransferase RimO [Candidatus Hydrogenedentota bacterium]
MRVGIVTLGCDKNTVDNEHLAGLLDEAGCEVVPSPSLDGPEELDAVVIATCGFICDAKEQSISCILEWGGRKRESGGRLRLFVTGCLAQRYAEELLAEMPEIDGIAGVGQLESLSDLLWRAGAPRNIVAAEPRVEGCGFSRRKRLDDKPYAFLKIADGCNHACTFCAIPGMKGPLRSVPGEALLREARGLLDQGVRELVLVAQDVAAYGQDRDRRYRLPELLRDLCALEGDFWVRCMYCYPGGITDALVETLRQESKVTPYLDIPLQHLDEEVLCAMRRPCREVDVFALVERLRRDVPGVVLRTTLLAGFPGETPAAHRRLLEGMKRLRFDWLGAFPYSEEEGTPAAEMKQVGKRTRDKRWREVMELQARITAERNEARVGRRVRVLVEEFDAVRSMWMGRSAGEAPEVDGAVFFEAEGPVAPGDFVEVVLTRAETYDVFGRAVA